MKKILASLGLCLALSLFFTLSLSAQSSMEESNRERIKFEKQRLKEERKVQKEERKEKKQSKEKISRKERKANIPKASAQMSAESRKQELARQKYRKGREGLTPAAKRQRKGNRKRNKRLKNRW